ncbi:MAG: alpha/beta hydrolase, partial [Verrucomicrobia bacterium]|nr:alpha/beta hydrolase [Verrucomicrobiota bacterium]
GSNPNDPGDGGLPPPANELMEVPFTVGDPSGSHSERWKMNIQADGPDDTRQFGFVSPDFGQMGTQTFLLRRGNSYTITLSHVATDRENGPDYDWQAQVDGLPATTVLAGGNSHSGPDRFETIQNAWLLDNGDGLLGIVNQSFHSTDHTVGKQARLLPVEILVDANRDGQIDQDDVGMITEDNPWRWWVNDDSDVIGEVRGNNNRDIPGQPVENQNAANPVIDGMRDLIDFFPLHLQIEALKDLFPFTEYRYLLAHEDEAFNFWESDLTKPANDSQYGVWSLQEPILSVTAANFILSENPPVVNVTQQGTELSEAIVAASHSGYGVLYMEGASKTEKPIALVIQNRTNQEEIFRLELPVRIVDVEDMYRKVNLRWQISIDPDYFDLSPQTRTTEPPEYPDSLTNGNYFIYIHGYNVSGQSSRGSQSNLFKRFHQLGSKARFVGLSWHGDPQTPLGTNSPADYQRAVTNALLVGKELADHMDFIPASANVTVLAHSLGNVLAGNAIANHGWQVDQYYMVNGASPLEAYDRDQSTYTGGTADMAEYMTENEWKPYYAAGQKRLFAANWHELFAADPQDPRNLLTWENLFAAPALLSVAYNFYSPGDEIVENAAPSEIFVDWNDLWNGNLKGRHAWVKQEIGKGGKSLFFNPLFHDANGGWEFNDGPNGYQKGTAFGWRKFTPQEAENEITDTLLTTKPFHRPFLFPEIYDPELGAGVAANLHDRYVLLATGIPAKSFAIAVNRINELEDLSRNFDMQAEMKSPQTGSHWPVQFTNYENDWLHSDFKDVALQFVYPLYKKMIEIAGLNED